MVRRNREFSEFKPGELAQINAERKGLRSRSLQPLGEGVILRHKPEEAALDWRKKPILGFRVHYRNPWPRLLVPVTGGRARLRFTLACRHAQALSPITMDCNGTLSVARPRRRWFGLIAWFAAYEVEIELQADQPTLLELQLTKQQQPIRKRRRLAIGPLRLRPA